MLSFRKLFSKFQWRFERELSLVSRSAIAVIKECDQSLIKECEISVLVSHSKARVFINLNRRKKEVYVKTSLLRIL